MAQIVVRNLEEDVKQRLKRRAVLHGRSMEEEVRDILREAVRDPDSRYGLGTEIVRRFSGAGIGLRKGEEIEEIRGEARPAVFDD